MEVYIAMKSLLKHLFVPFTLGIFLGCVSLPAFPCTSTTYNGLNAAIVNPTTTVTGPIDAGGCQIGVFFDNGKGSVDNAQIFNATYFGVVVDGDHNNVAVDIRDSSIHNIGENPFDGSQHGVAIYYRAYYLTGSASGTISGNQVSYYQKAGIVVNGQGASAVITDNTVTGQGPVAYIAQNGIQVGYAASASVMRNTVSGNSYTGTSTASGGILVLGGAGYGTCPDGNPCPYTTGTRIIRNTVTNNDVGIWVSDVDVGPDDNSPTSASNIKVVNNVISSEGLHNGYGGFGYQAGVADQGNNDKIINNSISGAGYNTATYPSAYVKPIDADTSFTNRPKVHANAFDGVKTP